MENLKNLSVKTFFCVQNETYLKGLDENGKDMTVVFDTIELLQFIDTDHMKENLNIYIDKL